MWCSILVLVQYIHSQWFLSPKLPPFSQDGMHCMWFLASFLDILVPNNSQLSSYRYVLMNSESSVLGRICVWIAILMSPHPDLSESKLSLLVKVLLLVYLSFQVSRAFNHVVVDNCSRLILFFSVYSFMWLL